MDASGRILVYTPAGLRRYASDGTFLEQLAITGSPVTDDADNIYLLDTVGLRKFDASGNLLGTFASWRDLGTDPKIAIDRAGRRVYVTDREGNARGFSYSGTPLGTSVLPGAGLPGVAAATFDASGRFHAARGSFSANGGAVDTGIQYFDDAFNLQRFVVACRQLAGIPLGALCTDSSGVFVTVRVVGIDEVRKYDFSGHLVTRLRDRPAGDHFSRVASDAHDRLYVSVEGLDDFMRIYRYVPTR